MEAMPHRFVAIDHVQLAMPSGREADAEAFYRDLLGFEMLEKPAPLAARGGRWFGSGSVQIHLGVDGNFHPARKAHPALVVEGLVELVGELEAAGKAVRWDEELPGIKRCFVDDPFDNRIELIELIER
ncbi:MAG: glyoxalase [Acidimicrobiales bacterium]